VTQFLRPITTSVGEQVKLTEWAPQNSEVPSSEMFLLCHTPKFHRLGIFEIWELVTISYSLPIRDLHLAFQIPYIYDYITKLCRQQAEVIQNHDNENVRTIGQGEARDRKYKRLKLGGGQAYDRSSV
jgi:hypothetical protein